MDGYQLYNIQVDDSLKEKTFSYIEKLYNSCPSVEEYAFMYARSQNVGFGCEKNYNKAIQIYEQLAEKGYANAQTNLGRCYDDGEGVTQDYAKAVYWCTKAAEQGHEDAQYNLSICYNKGEGVEKDYAKAAYWLTKAAEQCNENVKEVSKSIKKIIADKK